MTANNQDILSVRELQKEDIELIVSYWLESDSLSLLAMGVDLKKIPTKESLTQSLLGQLNMPLRHKQSYCIIWLLNNQPIGHSNTNPISYGKEAFMHLHIWDKTIRKKGLGAEFVKMTLPYFFENLKLQKIYCQPYALNPPPNKTLKKIGFNFVKEYITIPGSLNFEQSVLLWELTLEKFKTLPS